MASIVTLAKAKAQLRVVNNAEDELIQEYIDSAGDYIAKFLNYESVDLIPGVSDSPQAVPASIREAALMLITSSFEQRSALIVGTIVAPNPAVDRKLHFYRQDMGI